MAVRLSREPGRFCVVLEKPVWLEPALFAAPLAGALGIGRSDSVRICRLQRGILFEGATEQQARDVVDMLAAAGIAASAEADTALPLLPKPVHVSVASIEDDGLATPSLVGAGLPKVWAWPDLALLCGGILIGPEAHTSSLVDTIGDEVLAEAEDRRSLAARTLEKARLRVFPLRAEVERPEPQMGDTLHAALSGKGSENAAVEGFGAVSTVIDLLFTRPLERLRVAGSSRLTSIRRSSSRARDTHVAVAEIARHATQATLPGAALALADGADSGDYVFEDVQQFESHCRWAYFWRLRREAADTRP